MNRPRQALSHLFHDESGTTATEYICILITIACFVISIVKVFGMTLEHKYADANNAIARLVVF